MIWAIVGGAVLLLVLLYFFAVVRGKLLRKA